MTMHKFKLEEKYDPGRVLIEVSFTNEDMRQMTRAKVKAALFDKLCDRWDLEIIGSQRRRAKRTRS